MGTWGAGNFDNDAALDYIGEVVDAIEARIEACLADEDASALDEDGEGVLMPGVAILSVLYEHCKAPPPKPDAVLRWKRQYLAIFDEDIEGFDCTPGYPEERRAVIESTFDRLAAQAADCWRDVREE